jgi:hypothetical protein
LLSLSFVVLVGAPASADTIDASTRGTARKLGVEGITLFEKGDYAGALEKLETADRLVPAHTLGVRVARCLVKLGRLVEASEKYLEVARRPFDGAPLPAQKKAMQEAIVEREDLLAKIPAIVVHLRGARPDEVTLTLDGKPLSSALLDQKTLVDPGSHKLSVERGGKSVSISVTVAIGRVEDVTPDGAPRRPPPPAPPHDPLVTLGWVGVGVGVGGLASFTVNGLASIGQASALDASCPGRRCGPEQHGALDLYDASRVTTTVSLVGGVVLVGAGLGLLLSRPSRAVARPSKAGLVWAPRPHGVAVSF